MGRHVISVGMTRGKEVAKLFFIQEVIFPSSNTAAKISILLLYNSLFGAACDRRIHVALRALGALWLLLGIVGTFSTAFPCIPAPYSWTANHSEKCLDLKDLMLGLAASNTTLNLATLLLAIPMIWKLHLSKRQKFFVALLFALGGG